MGFWAPFVDPDEFDRWLAAHDRRVKSEALHEASDRLDARISDGSGPRDVPLWLCGEAHRIAAQREDHEAKEADRG